MGPVFLLLESSLAGMHAEGSNIYLRACSRTRSLFRQQFGNNSNSQQRLVKQVTAVTPQSPVQLCQVAAPGTPKIRWMERSLPPEEPGAPSTQTPAHGCLRRLYP